jgi:hypothetical protein
VVLEGSGDRGRPRHDGLGTASSRRPVAHTM